MYRKDWIARWAMYTPDQVALKEYDSGRSLTYKTLNEQACFLADKFINRFRLKTGCRLMVMAEQCLEFVALFSMAQKTGITLVPLNFRLAPTEIDYLISDAEPELLIVQRKFADKVDHLKSDVQVIWLEDLGRELQGCPLIDFENKEIPEDHPLFILYTSGTTGFPKGAVYSHKMLFWNSVNTTLSLSLDATDLTINCAPSFHTGGWNVLLAPLLHRGGTVGLLKKFDADRLLALMESEGCKLFFGVPTMLKMMSESELFQAADLGAMRYFIVGGEALPLAVIRQWHDKGVRIRQGYGLTEVGPNITSLHQDDAETKIGSIGKPNFYVEHKVVNDQNVPVNPGDIGELCLKGPMMTPGYWKNPEATALAIREGWFHTGDLVKEDEEGYLYVVDRKKSMFISGGENVYPAEVEKVLRQCPTVDEAAVIGVPDSQWGEVGRAYVSLKPGALFCEEEIRSYCLRHLAKFKVPKYLVLLTELPKNDSGKLDRKQLK